MKLIIKKDDNMRNSNALFNEFKGFLFEYLVAKEIGFNISNSHIGLKDSSVNFHKNISPSLISRLVQYEQLIRIEKPELLSFLALSSKKMSVRILEIVEGNVLQIKMSGKNQSSIFSEEDLILVTSNNQYYLSLKFYKEDQAINTKSGGIFSFIEKYFSIYNREFLLSLQQDLNKFVAKNYDNFCSEMINEMKEVVLVDEKVEVLLKQYLKKHLLSELPGQLPERFKLIVHRYYSNIRQSLFVIFQKLYLTNKEHFKEALMALLGFSLKDEIQCSLIYSDKSTKSVDSEIINTDFQIKELNFLNYDELFLKLTKIEFVNTSNRSYFDIIFEGFKLSIRIKPMNKFTAKGVKINCSLKRN